MKKVKLSRAIKSNDRRHEKREDNSILCVHVYIHIYLILNAPAFKKDSYKYGAGTEANGNNTVAIPKTEKLRRYENKYI